MTWVIIIAVIVLIIVFAYSGTSSNFSKLQKLVSSSPDCMHDFFEYMEKSGVWKPSGPGIKGSMKILIFDSKITDSILELKDPELYKREISSRMPIPYWFIYTGADDERKAFDKMYEFVKAKHDGRSIKTP